MISTQIGRAAFMSGDQRTRLLEAVLIAFGGVAVATFVLIPTAGLIVVIGCTAIGFILVVSEVCRGEIDRTLLCWAALFPLGYYFASFPRQQPIVTLDRVVILVAFMGVLLAKPCTLLPIPKTLRQAGLFWMGFIAVGCVTLGKSPSFLNAARNLLDSFLLPVLLAWCVIARFDVRGRLPAIHTALCISSIICAAVGAAEVVTGRDLLPIGGSTIYFAGGIVRPNGPFESNDTLALIGATSVFLMLFLRATLGPKLTSGRRMLHWIGLVAAIGMALMPMFRSVAITLLLALIIDTFWEHGTVRRARRVALIVGFVGLVFMAAVFAPDMFEDRSSSENVYARVAQFQQSLRVFEEHPLLGVGFLNFHEFVVGESRYRTSYQGVSSVDGSHDNLAQILTEDGILGFVPYVIAHVLLFRAMWQLRQLSRSGYLAWKYYFYLFLTYWLTGLTESSGYSPFNLWYLFATAIFYKYVLTAPDCIQPTELLVPAEA
jgi:O-antigen ligase